jgi:hypothetical protein
MAIEILCGANTRRREADVQDDPVLVDVTMSAATVQISGTVSV